MVIINEKISDWACVKIKLASRKGSKKKYVVCNGLYVLKEPTLMMPLPENMEIVDENGAPIKATGRFYITAETIDPYHLVTDLF